MFRLPYPVLGAVFALFPKECVYMDPRCMVAIFEKNVKWHLGRQLEWVNQNRNIHSDMFPIHFKKLSVKTKQLDSLKKNVTGIFCLAGL